MKKSYNTGYRLFPYSLTPPANQARPSRPHARGPSIATLSLAPDAPRVVDVAEGVADTDVGVRPTPAVEPFWNGLPVDALATRRDE